MTKPSAVLASGLLAIVLAGCAQPPASIRSSSSAPASSAQYKACLITDADTTAGSPAQQATAGLDRVATQLGVEVDHATAASAADYAKALQTLIDGSCTVIAAVGSSVAGATQAAAKANPSVRFILVDATPTESLANLRPLSFNTQESAFLAGYLAAAMSATGKVGTFGALNLAAVTIYMDGFVQGVQHYNQAKQAQVVALGWDMTKQSGTFVQSSTSPWDDTAAGQNAAQSLTGQGADVIFAVAGAAGAGALQLAGQTQGLRVIWSDSDGCQTNQAQTNQAACAAILTSVVKDRAAGVFEAIRADHDGGGSSGVLAGTLRNGGTHLSSLASDVPAVTRAEIDALSQSIIGGAIKVTSPSAVG